MPPANERLDADSRAGGQIDLRLVAEVELGSFQRDTQVAYERPTLGRPRVHAARYAWPHGYAYGRRAVGWIMPRPFLTSAYYYSGYAALGLAAPHAGYHWVRYGPDLLLVQVATGRVADVRYGVFDG